jgi:hypothetical protein
MPTPEPVENTLSSDAGSGGLRAAAPAELVRYRDIIEPLLALDSNGPAELPADERASFDAGLVTLKGYHGNHLDLEEAVAAFARALWAAPHFAEPPARIAEALCARVKRWPEPSRSEALDLARALADRALQIDPVSQAGRIAAARVRLALGLIGEAERIAQALPQDHAPSLAVRSEIAEAGGDLGEAIRLREAQIAAEREATALREARNKLGLLYQAAQRLDEACRVHRENLARHPDFAWGHVNLGSALEARGETLEAFAAVEAATRFGLVEARPFLDELGAALDRSALERFRSALRTGRDGATVDWCPLPDSSPADEIGA